MVIIIVTSAGVQSMRAAIATCGVAAKEDFAGRTSVRLAAARRASVDGAEHRDRRDGEAVAGTLTASSASGGRAKRAAAMFAGTELVLAAGRSGART